MSFSKAAIIAVSIVSILFSGCNEPEKSPGAVVPTSLGDVAAVRLSYRYEADVPAPTIEEIQTRTGTIDAAVAADFQINRPDESISSTVASADGSRIAVVYSRPTDEPGDYRLDMYDASGKPLRKLTSDLMAVHFPETIRWSPDGRSLAFVAMLRTASAVPEPVQTPGSDQPATVEGTDSNSNSAPVAPAEPTAAPTPEAPTGILTFRTDQLYVADADGGVTRPLTQNESLIYYFYEWSPDSTMLVTLAATSVEWNYLERMVKGRGEVFVPAGRPRVVEKNGRERLLDDALTSVYPVWSPDSSKIACAFDKQIRVYDASGTVPTQAAIPLRNNLLLSSQAYDQAQSQTLGAESSNGELQQPASNANTSGATLPDPNTLVSFNPIVTLHWPSSELLYFQTAFIKRMLNDADSVSSFPRWHRLILSAQAGTN